MAAGLPFDSALDLWRADPGAVLVAISWECSPPSALRCEATAPGADRACLRRRPACASLRSASRRLWLGLTAAGVLLFSPASRSTTANAMRFPCCPFYAIGCTGLAAILPGERIRRRGAWLVALGCLALLIGYGAAIDRSVDPNRYYQPVEIRELAADLRTRGVPLDPEDAVAARKPHVGYWLGLRQAGSRRARRLRISCAIFRRKGRGICTSDTPSWCSGRICGRWLTPRPRPCPPACGASALGSGHGGHGSCRGLVRSAGPGRAGHSGRSPATGARSGIRLRPECRAQRL